MSAFSRIFAYKELILSGLKITISLAILDIILCTVIGAVCAITPTNKGKNPVIRVLKIIIRFYIEVFRGSPILLQLFFMYYGLGYLGVDMPLFESCLLTMALHHGAFVTEIFRSGIEAIPKGQYEAGKCIGLSSFKIMWKIVLPQAFRVFLPPLIGYYISLIQDIPMVSLVGLADLVKNAKTIMGNTYLPLQTYLLVACIYFVICYPMSLYVKYLEKKRATARG